MRSRKGAPNVPAAWPEGLVSSADFCVLDHLSSGVGPHELLFELSRGEPQICPHPQVVDCAMPPLQEP